METGTRDAGMSSSGDAGIIPLKPALKWVGGKHQLLDVIRPLIPAHSTYVEPFVGGGAVLFDLQPRRAVINDANAELINVYRCIRDYTDDLINALRWHSDHDTADYYYAVRAWDREDGFDSRSPVDRAARMLYLNKTCFNGLYRVNAAGQFNAPYGRYRDPNIVNESGIRALAAYLAGDITIMCGDYTAALNELSPGSFVYLDPPYMASFTRYTQDGFDLEEQTRLRDTCDMLTAQGIPFLESNSDTPEIRELYRNYDITTVSAVRVINSRGDQRGAVNEVLIHG